MSTGRPRVVFVDDYLPTYVNDPSTLTLEKGVNNTQVAFCGLQRPEYFWCCLLEKAYAKVVGSYEHIVGGYEDEAMAEMPIAESIRSSVRCRIDLPPRFAASPRATPRPPRSGSMATTATTFGTATGEATAPIASAMPAESPSLDSNTPSVNRRCVD